MTARATACVYDGCLDTWTLLLLGFFSAIVKKRDAFALFVRVIALSKTSVLLIIIIHLLATRRENASLSRTTTSTSELEPPRVAQFTCSPREERMPHRPAWRRACPRGPEVCSLGTEVAAHSGRSCDCCQHRGLFFVK